MTQQYGYSSSTNNPFYTPNPNNQSQMQQQSQQQPQSSKGSHSQSKGSASIHSQTHSHQQQNTTNERMAQYPELNWALINRWKSWYHENYGGWFPVTDWEIMEFRTFWSSTFGDAHETHEILSLQLTQWEKALTSAAAQLSDLLLSSSMNLNNVEQTQLEWKKQSLWRDIKAWIGKKSQCVHSMENCKKDWEQWVLNSWDIVWPFKHWGSKRPPTQ